MGGGARARARGLALPSRRRRAAGGARAHTPETSRTTEMMLPVK